MVDFKIFIGLYTHFLKDLLLVLINIFTDIAPVEAHAVMYNMYVYAVSCLLFQRTHPAGPQDLSVPSWAYHMFLKIRRR